MEPPIRTDRLRRDRNDRSGRGGQVRASGDDCSFRCVGGHTHTRKSSPATFLRRLTSWRACARAHVCGHLCVCLSVCTRLAWKFEQAAPKVCGGDAYPCCVYPSPHFVAVCLRSHTSFVCVPTDVLRCALVCVPTNVHIRVLAHRCTRRRPQAQLSWAPLLLRT